MIRGHRPLLYSAPSAAAMDEFHVDATVDLVERPKSGAREALERLFSRFLPSLQRWASGRLPRWTRDLIDTDDLVQEAVFRALRQIDTFESRHEGVDLSKGAEHRFLH